MPLPNRSTAETFDAVNKTNDQFQPPANQPLNWDNTKLAPGVSDIAGLGLTACRMWLRMQLASSTGSLVLLNSWAVWSNATITLPTLSRTTIGIFTVTLPTMVSDEYDASFNLTNNIPVNLSAAIGSFELAPGLVTASAAGNVITVNTYNATASANDMVGNILFLRAF